MSRIFSNESAQFEDIKHEVVNDTIIGKKLIISVSTGIFRVNLINLLKYFLFGVFQEFSQFKKYILIYLGLNLKLAYFATIYAQEPYGIEIHAHFGIHGVCFKKSK